MNVMFIIIIGTVDSDECQEDADCVNIFYCDGEEACVDGECISGDPIDCDDGLWCDEVSESCLPLDELSVPWYDNVYRVILH